MTKTRLNFLLLVAGLGRLRTRMYLCNASSEDPNETLCCEVCFWNKLLRLYCTVVIGVRCPSSHLFLVLSVFINPTNTLVSLDCDGDKVIPCLHCTRRTFLNAERPPSGTWFSHCTSAGEKKEASSWSTIHSFESDLGDFTSPRGYTIDLVSKPNWAPLGNWVVSPLLCSFASLLLCV